MRVTKSIHEIYGHATAKRALEIALTGGHDILLWGPRGAGKTTLIEAFGTGVEMDSCGCGSYASVTRECTCSPANLRRWLHRLIRVAPRFDIVIEVPMVPVKEMLIGAYGEPTAAEVFERIRVNSDRCRMLRGAMSLDDPGERTLEMCVRRMSLTAGQHDAILRVARTIANMAASPQIKAVHVAEACQYQSLAAMQARAWSGGAA